jgi:hypothetical protein
MCRYVLHENTKIVYSTSGVQGKFFSNDISLEKQNLKKEV